MDKTSVNIGLSKHIEALCESVKIHIYGVKDFHLYSPITELYTDLDRVIADAQRIKRLLIRLETGRASEKDQSRQT